MLPAPLGTAKRATPDLVEDGGRLFAFWVDDTSAVRFKSTAHSGPDGKGGCLDGPGKIDPTIDSGGTPCHSLLGKAEFSLPGSASATGVSVLSWNGYLIAGFVRNDSPTAASLWVVVGQHTGGGSVTWQSPVQLATDIVWDSEVELSEMFVEPAVFGSSRVAAAFVAEKDGSSSRYAMYHWNGTLLPWTRRSVVTTGGAYIPGRRAPAVTTWPHRSAMLPNPESVGFACGVFGTPKANPTCTYGTSPSGCLTGQTCTPANRCEPTTANDTFHLLCYNKALDGWFETGQSGFDLIGRRPSIAWHSLRRAAPTPSEVAPFVQDDPTRGQFWISIVSSGDEGETWSDHLMVSHGFHAGSPPGTSWPRPLPTLGRLWDAWTITAQKTGIPLFESGAVSSVKGLYISPRKDRDVPNEASGVLFDKRVLLPFVDGTFDVDLSDANDWAIFERGICRGLNHSSPGWPECG